MGYHIDKMIRQVKNIFILVALSWGLFVGNSLAKNGVKESELKSVFIINILNYVQWPKSKLSNPQQICIYAINPFEKYLEKFAQLSTSKRKKAVNILYPKKLKELSNCHIIFISRSSINELESILKLAEKNSILTISDIPDFAEKKGMVEFVSKEDLIKLHINFSSTKAAGLEMSYLLLDLAEKVIKDKVAKK